MNYGCTGCFFLLLGLALVFFLLAQAFAVYVASIHPFLFVLGVAVFTAVVVIVVMERQRQSPRG